VIKRIKLYLSIFPFLPLSEVSHNASHVDLNFSLFLILWQRWNVDNVTYIDPPSCASYPWGICKNLQVNWRTSRQMVNVEALKSSLASL
jgi:hypothetical protein